MLVESNYGVLYNSTQSKLMRCLYCLCVLILRGRETTTDWPRHKTSREVAARDGPKQQPSDGINPRYKAWSTCGIVTPPGGNSSVQRCLNSIVPYTAIQIPGASPFSARRSIRANLPCPYKEAPESCFKALLFLLSSLSLFLLYLPSPDLSFLKLSLVLFDFGQSLFSVLTNYHHSLSSTNYFYHKNNKTLPFLIHNAFHCCFRCSLRRPCCRRPSG